MPRLYLFRIKHLPSQIARRVAVIIKTDFDPELRKITQGEVTNYFDPLKQPNDGVDYKGSIEITQQVYDVIVNKMEKVGKNTPTKVIQQGGKITFNVNSEELHMVTFATRSQHFIEYPYVFIKG